MPAPPEKRFGDVEPVEHPQVAIGGERPGQSLQRRALDVERGVAHLQWIEHQFLQRNIKRLLGHAFDDVADEIGGD
jgi:hypothetical protein